MQSSNKYQSATTQIFEVGDFDPKAYAWQYAVQLVESDSTIVAPTDTVYGVMCRYDHASAVANLFRIKQRPLKKAIPVLIGDYAQLTMITGEPVTERIQVIMERFWPGPLTLILPADEALPFELTAGGSTVGVRMPDHTALREFMRVVGPLAATSANMSGDREAVTAKDAQEQLGGLVPIILSDDATVRRPVPPVPSTVLELSQDTARILRAGPISQQVCEVLRKMGFELC